MPHHVMADKGPSQLSDQFQTKSQPIDKRPSCKCFYCTMVIAFVLIVLDVSRMIS